MSHGHKRVECKICKTVISTCRCWKAAENIEYIVCAECEKIPDDTCCCGDPMEGHASPINCGHSPVSMRDHYASKEQT
jgi:hypothetical protein